MDSLQTALIVLIIIQSVILVIIALVIIVIFIQIKKAAETVNHILRIGEDIAEGVQSATKAGLVGLIGTGIKQALKILRTKSAKR